MSRSSRISVVLACIVAALLVALYGTWQLSKSRTHQLMGSLVNHVNTTERVVALSFDDGPDPRYIDEVLGILDRHSAKATFFLVGRSLSENMDCGRKIVAAGHEIGNHTWSHRQLVFTTLRTISHEIESTDRKIIEAGQVQPILFRPPYSKRLVLLPYYLKVHDRSTVLWDVEPDSLPAHQNDVDFISNDAVSKTRPGSIILMHVLTESRAASRAALPRILDELERDGYKMVTVGRLLSKR